MSFKEEMSAKTDYINEEIGKYLPVEEGYQKTVLEAMNYSILAGGKRLRPLLMNETYRMLGGSNDRLIGPFMAAIEMIHTYSLVHDDLPAMDNDEYRRGRRTTHAVYGEAMGILAGDALLNYAYETAFKAFCGCNVQEEQQRVISALKVLGYKAGIYGMVGGQVKDVEATLKSEIPDRDELDFIYRLKTGALLEASVMIGAILAGASDDTVKLLENAASKIGMAFQIQDDILDVTGDSAVLGKPVGSDDKNSKTTYVTLYGIDSARCEVKRLTDEAAALLDNVAQKEEFLVRLLWWLVNREK